MESAEAVQVVNLFYDLKVEFSAQFPRVEERVLADLKKLREGLAADPPGSPYDLLRERFIKEIDVMLSMVQGTLVNTGEQLTSEYTKKSVLIEKGEE